MISSGDVDAFVLKVKFICSKGLGTNFSTFFFKTKR